VSERPTDDVAIVGDPDHLWSYAWYGMALALLVAVICDIVFASRGGVHWYDLVAAALGTSAMFGLVLGLVCLSWKRRILPVSYHVTSEAVRVLRHGAEIARYERPDIRSAEFIGAMDYRAMITRLTYDPSWPHLRLEIGPGSSRRHVDLPEVMIWGRDRVRQAESAVRATLGVSSSSRSAGKAGQ